MPTAKDYISKSKVRIVKKTCKMCGIVEEGHLCPYRKSRQKSGDRESDKFRNTAIWQKKRDEIKQKSKYLCEVCLEGKHHTLNTINYKNIEVHHIVPIGEDYNKRLDNDNLICLCSFHHKMAENGIITKEELMEIVKRRDENEDR